jgi:hypothetical protein
MHLRALFKSFLESAAVQHGLYNQAKFCQKPSKISQATQHEKNCGNVVHRCTHNLWTIKSLTL